MIGKTAIYTFCVDHCKDKAAPHIWSQCERIINMTDSGIVVDEMPVKRHIDETGNSFFFVRTREVVSHNYTKYAPLLCELFSQADLIGIVNWHEGENAPDNILTAHTTGDVPSGYFGRTDPKLILGVLLALDHGREEQELENYRVISEATHWSGIPYGQDPTLIEKIPVPVVDIEIGSSRQSWADPKVATAVATALPLVFSKAPDNCISLLCLGGTHFEDSFCNAAMTSNTRFQLGISHILPNQWLVTGEYIGERGIEKLRRAVTSIAGGVQGVVFHDKLKGIYKDAGRNLAAELGIPSFKHNRLKQPGQLVDELQLRQRTGATR